MQTRIKFFLILIINTYHNHTVFKTNFPGNFLIGNQIISILCYSRGICDSVERITE